MGGRARLKMEGKIKAVNFFKAQYPLRYLISGYDSNGSRHGLLVPRDHGLVVYCHCLDSQYYTEECMESVIKFLKRNGVFVCDAEMVSRRLLYGGIPADCFRFRVSKGFEQIRYFREKGISCHIPCVFINDDIEERLQYTNRRGIKFCGWLKFSASSTVTGSDGLIFSVVEPDNIWPVEPDDAVCDAHIPYKIVMFDIETEGLGGDEPEAVKDDNDRRDNIFQISAVLDDRGREISHTIFSAYPVREDYIVSDELGIDRVNVVNCGSVRELLIEFFNYISDTDPDIIGGYNILSFDWLRILTEAKRQGLNESLWLHSARCKEFRDIIGFYKNRVVDKEWKSAAYANNKFLYVEMEGRANMDIMMFVKRNCEQMPNYTLKAVAAKYLPGQLNKLDVSYKELEIVSCCHREISRQQSAGGDFDALRATLSRIVAPYSHLRLLGRLYNKLSERDLTLGDLREEMKYHASEIARYCIVDSKLCHELAKKLDITGFSEQMANLVNIPLEDVTTRGQVHRVMSMCYGYLERNGLVMDKPTSKYAEVGGKITGATVLTPDVGYHNGVLVMDFESLYPSIIQQFNLCFTTIRDSPSETTRTIHAPEGTFHFEQKVKGIMPLIMDELKGQRKAIVLAMKLMPDKDSHKYKMMDAKQKAMKIVANSGYGFMAGSTGRPMPAVAVCVTAKGRDNLMFIRNALCRRGCKVIYGDTDSCMVIPPTNVVSSWPFISHSTPETIVKILNTIPNVSRTEEGCIFYDGDDIDLFRADLQTKFGFHTSDRRLDVSRAIEDRLVKLSATLAKDVCDELNDHERYVLHQRLEFSSLCEGPFDYDDVDATRRDPPEGMAEDDWDAIRYYREGNLPQREAFVEKFGPLSGARVHILRRSPKNAAIFVDGKCVAKAYVQIVRTKFVLCPETCNEHFFLQGKKSYVTRPYGSTKLKMKGVMAVRRNYANVEKEIFLRIIRDLFSAVGVDTLDSFADACQTLFLSTPCAQMDDCKCDSPAPISSYVISVSFETLERYSVKLKDDIWVDSNGENFEYKKNKNDDRLTFKSKMLNVALAKDMIHRGETPDNSRIEYVFSEPFLNANRNCKKKSDTVTDFLAFFDNRHAVRIRKIEYIKRLTGPIQKIVDIVRLRPKPLVPNVHVFILAQMLTRLTGSTVSAPRASDLAKLVVTQTGGGTRTLSFDETDRMFQKHSIQPHELFDGEWKKKLMPLRYDRANFAPAIDTDDRTEIAEQYEELLSQEKKYTLTTTAKLDHFYAQIATLAKAILSKHDSPPEVMTVASTINSGNVIEKYANAVKYSARTYHLSLWLHGFFKKLRADIISEKIKNKHLKRQLLQQNMMYVSGQHNDDDDHLSACDKLVLGYALEPPDAYSGGVILVTKDGWAVCPDYAQDVLNTCKRWNHNNVDRVRVSLNKAKLATLTKFYTSLSSFVKKYLDSCDISSWHAISLGHEFLAAVAGAANVRKKKRPDDCMSVYEHFESRTNFLATLAARVAFGRRFLV